jgi:hypothetical protein
MIDKIRLFVLRILIFTRVVDAHDLNLSFTNIALIIVLTKLMFVQTTSIMDLGALLVSLANFNLKKYINVANNIQTVSDKLTKKVEEIVVST